MTAALSTGWPSLYAQVRGSDIQPIREFPDTSLLTISPDGKHFVFYSTKVPVETAVALEGAIRKSRSEHGTDKLWILDQETNAVIFEKQTGTRVSDASYFADGQKLFYLTMEGTNRGAALSNVVVDLERQSTAISTTLQDRFYKAIGPNRLIAIEGHEKIVTVALPNYQTIGRVSLGTAPQDRWERVSLDRVSADRSTLIYVLDRRRVVYRRTTDLGRPVWASSIESRFKLGAMEISLSPNARWLAVGCAENRLRNNGGAVGIMMFDAEDGKTVARFGLEPYERIGVSPNGKLLAVGERHKESGQSVTAVHLYDVATQKEVGRVEHQRRVLGRNQDLLGGLAVDGIQFTADSKYLITSGHDVRVWRVG